MIIFGDTKIYQLNFGMKSLIILNEYSDMIEQDNLTFLLYCGLVGSHPDIELDEIEGIVQGLDNPLELGNILVEHIKENLISELKIAEYQQKAIGELGLTLNDFYVLTPEEIDNIYNGYMKRKEIEVNLNRLAFTRALNNNSDYIELLEKQYERAFKEGLEDAGVKTTKLPINTIESAILIPKFAFELGATSPVSELTENPVIFSLRLPSPCLNAVAYSCAF